MTCSPNFSNPLSRGESSLAERFHVFHLGPLACIAVRVLGRMSHQMADRFGFSLQIASSRLGGRRRPVGLRLLARFIGGRSRILIGPTRHVKIELSQFIDLALVAFSNSNQPFHAQQSVQEVQDTLVVSQSDLQRLRSRLETNTEYC